MSRTSILVTLAVLALVGFTFYSAENKTATSVSKHYLATTLSASGDITCTYPQTLSVSYKRDEVTHELPNPETNPIIMTFSDFDSDIAKVKFIDATQTISELPIVKIVDNLERLVFLEGTGETYITMHTIYKNSGVATYEKSASLLGIPVGTMAMGTCVDY